MRLRFRETPTQTHTAPLKIPCAVPVRAPSLSQCYSEEHACAVFFPGSQRPAPPTHNGNQWRTRVTVTQR